MALRAKATVDNTGIVLGGSGIMKDDLTLAQDGARAAVLAPFTILAQQASDLKLVPLIDVDPALVPSNMACGAIGGTAAEFAALASASFGIGVDGETAIQVVCDFSGLDSVLDTPGYMTCGAIGGTLPEFAAVNDAEFGVTVDGTLINVTCDFSGLDSIVDTAGYLTCGAIGGTLAEFAAVADAQFGIAVNGGAPFQVGPIDFSGINSVLDTAGYLTCGAIGGTLPEFQAVADAQFGITLDGQAEIQVGPIDYSGLDTEADTPGYWTCGANGDIIGNWDALADAAFSYVANGVAYDTGAMNLTASVTFDGLVNIINWHLLGHATLTYSYTDDIFILTSNTTGETSTITIGAPAAGTDISAAGYLNAAAGAATDGTGGEGTAQTISDITNAALVADGAAAFCYFNGDAFVFVSQARGEVSAVADLTAGGAGTDVSGAGFFNGLAGANVAGTGGENLGQNISDTVNAAALGRFTCHFDGDAFIFTSTRYGETSQVDDLTAGTAGTDVSGAGFFNGLAGANVQGVGGENLGQNISDIVNAESAGRFTCHFDGDAFVFTSRTAGELSTVADLTAGAGGTDVSGAAFFNGLAGANVAGTGGEGLFESIVDIINAELAGRAEVSFDGDQFIFWSPTQGLGSAVSVLTAGTTGTDVSGAAFLNGLTGTGTITAATTGDGTDTPSGIFWGSEVLAATLVSGDVTNRKVIVGGDMYRLDEAKLVFEGGLDIDDIITSSGKTIRQHLELMGIYTRDTFVNTQVAPI